MSKELSLAFEMPEARAEATGGDVPLDRIAVRDYTRHVEIGAFQSERGVGQRVRFNIVLEVSASTASQDDDVDKVMSYDTIVEAIEAQLAEERINLLETLAERIAERVLMDHRAVRIFVRIEKLDRIEGTLGIEIVRTRKQKADKVKSRRKEQLDIPHPMVVYLSQEVLHSAHLESWLNHIAQRGEAAIICVEGFFGAARDVHPLAQRRIDLLAIEQAAWELAGRDKRCVVVDSRTELNWAMRHGQLSVWAPSKIILDAVNPPKIDIRDTAALALWFADLFDAEELVLIGGESRVISTDTPFRYMKSDEPQLL